ncbi:putative cell survival pathways protein [Chytriomyces hyalinus]|nr:putative cell survival pathways protein [Chytriomyces hyalinus]
MSWLFGTEEVKTFPKTPVVRQPDPVAADILLSDDLPIESLAATSDDVKWQLEYPTAATEAFTFYITADSGIYVLAQMVYSTLGLAPSVQMTCRLYGPNKEKFAQTLAPATTSFLLSDDKLSVTCEQFSINHNAATGGYHILFNLGEEATVDAVFEPTDGLFKVNDGKSLFHETETEGYIQTAYMPKAKVAGSITFKGVKSDAKGSGMFLRAIQCKPQCVQKFNFVNLQTANDAVMLYEFEMPKDGGYKASCVSIGAIVRNGKTLAVTTKNKSVFVQKQLDEDFSGYDVPTQLFYTWNGKTKETGEDVRIEMSLVQTNLVDKIDVLAELPYLLRVFIQTFITAPFLYQWFEEVTAKVTVGSEEFEIRGKAFIECSFLMAEY